MRGSGAAPGSISPAALPRSCLQALLCTDQCTTPKTVTRFLDVSDGFSPTVMFSEQEVALGTSTVLRETGVSLLINGVYQDLEIPYGTFIPSRTNIRIWNQCRLPILRDRRPRFLRAPMNTSKAVPTVSATVS